MSARPADDRGPGLGGAPRRGRNPVHTGQIVASQVAVASMVAGVGRGPLPMVGASVLAIVLLLLSWIRFRGRWLSDWTLVGARYLSRRCLRQPGRGPAQVRTTDGPARLLDAVAPLVELLPADLVGDPACVLSDPDGMTAVLELGDPADLVGGTHRLPSPADLLPPPTPDLPRVTLRLLLTGAPAPAVGTSPGAAAYRQLADGRLLARERALLAVRVARDGGWSEDDLRHALSAAVRRLRRRLRPLPARPLGGPAVLDAVAELALDGGGGLIESWTTVRCGDLFHSAYRLHSPTAEPAAVIRLLPRLLALPAHATTVALTVGPGPEGGDDATMSSTVVRLVASSPGELAAAEQAMHRLLAAERTGGGRMDGEQVPGLAATLPVGGPPPRPGPALPPAAVHGADLTIGGAGVLLGPNRHGSPVMLRIFRPVGTRLALVGGIRAAQLVVLRALALGADVVIRTTRPMRWDSITRAVAVPRRGIRVVPPGRAAPVPTGTPGRPVLVVVDAGPIAADPAPNSAWVSTMVVRDELIAADVEAVGQADLVILQPLRPDEAALAGSALGLGGSADWLSRIRDDMVGVVHRRSVRWVLLSATPVEAQLVAPPAPRGARVGPGIGRDTGGATGMTPSPAWVS